jgi:hypothetical protein
MLGFGFYHWYVLFGLIFVLFLPYMLACEGIVHGGTTGWRKNPLEYLAPSPDRASWLGVKFFEHQKRWIQAFARRPRWLKRLDFIVFGYSFITFVVPFLIKIHTKDSPNIFSLTVLPASIVFVISSGWMMVYWGFFSTFWLVSQINLEP